MHDEYYVDPERAAFEQFKNLPRDESIDMLNLVRFRDFAAYPASHPQHGAAVTGADAYRSYSRESGPVFARVGGRIIWSAAPKLLLIGPAKERWDAIFVARYPTATAFLEMVTDDAYRRAVIHRQAAVLTSRLIRTALRDEPRPTFG
nr:DUF1330 domain-containing protein [uncultured Sphingomonas sp.]